MNAIDPVSNDDPARARPHSLPEIEVNPEMIEAGRAILDADTAQDIIEGWVNAAEVVQMIYRAMREAYCANPLERSAPLLSADKSRPS